jgi:hypothetical protein
MVRFGQWLNGAHYAAAGFEHAFVVITVDGMTMEAQPGGAAIGSVHHHPDAVYYSCPDEARSAVCREAFSLKGTPYSFADYAALAALRLHITPLDHALERYVASSGHMICSQLVDCAYQRAGVQLFDDHRMPGDVTPADLYELIERQAA